MKAAVLNNGKFIIDTIPDVDISQGQKGAIIRVLGCGLCGSDIVKIRTGTAKNGAVLGHEVVGEIVKIDTDTDFEVGNLVALGHHVPCFECTYCWNQNYSMCKTFKKTNIFPGGFSEYIFVSELHLQNTVFNVPVNLSEEEASFMEPLGCCIRAVKRAKLFNNSKVLIVGLGSVGILMGQAVKALGNISYGCDLIPERLEFAKKYGFEEVCSADYRSLSDLKDKYSYIGFDAIFLTAGASASIPEAIKMVRDGGTILVFSSVKDDFAGFPNNEIYYRELNVMSSYSSSPMDLEDAIDFLATKEVVVDGISTHYALENINDALNDTITNKIMKAYITL